MKVAPSLCEKWTNMLPEETHFNYSKTLQLLIFLRILTIILLRKETTCCRNRMCYDLLSFLCVYV